jgi:flagellar capping protein FliD
MSPLKGVLSQGDLKVNHGGMKRVFGVGSGKKEKEPSLEDVQSSISGRSSTVDERIDELNEQMRKLKKQHDNTRSQNAQNSLKRRMKQLLQQRKKYEQRKDKLTQQQLNVDEITFAQQDVRDTKAQVRPLARNFPLRA